MKEHQAHWIDDLTDEQIERIIDRELWPTALIRKLKEELREPEKPDDQ